MFYGEILTLSLKGTSGIPQLPTILVVILEGKAFSLSVSADPTFQIIRIESLDDRENYRGPNVQLKRVYRLATVVFMSNIQQYNIVNNGVWGIILRVSEAMRLEVPTISEEGTVMEASKKMREMKHGCAIILRDDKPVGIITERDVTWNVAGEGLDPRSLKVNEIMSSPLITVEPNADLIDAAKLMCKNKIRRLAVIGDHELKGILTAADIAANLEGYVDTEIRKILRAAFFPIPH